MDGRYSYDDDNKLKSRKISEYQDKSLSAEKVKLSRNVLRNANSLQHSIGHQSQMFETQNMVDYEPDCQRLKDYIQQNFKDSELIDYDSCAKCLIPEDKEKKKQ